MSKITDIIAGVLSPVTGVLTARQERKKAIETARIKLQGETVEGEKQVTFNDQEWEAIQSKMQGTTWKDEYVTVSVVSILNLIVLGGILQAFGVSQVLVGIVTSVGALVELGLDVGTIMEAVIYAALGLHVLRKL